MKIVFMGTPDFAVKSLERLYSDGYNITGVFTQPDKPRNRGMKMSYSPVKELAIIHNTPVYQPLSLKSDEFTGFFRSLDFDLLVVVAYGKILPKEVLDTPQLGSINIHGSLLPKYRGAAPIQWAIMNGETKTGVTSLYMTEEVDAGDMLFTKETHIDANETAGELYDRLSILGAELLSATISSLVSGKAVRIPQDNTIATFAPLITKDMLPIKWSNTANVIKCQVRGLAPKPAATTEIEGINCKIFRVEIGATSYIAHKSPGEVISKGNHGIEVACADGSILIKELQAPGGKRMNASDFLRGRQ